jgi:hypothetical protein
MSYFDDLSEYSYAGSKFHRPGTRNVGWLERGFDFEETDADEDEDLLDLVWDYCTLSVAQTRGMHECDLCPGCASNVAERKGQKLLLGSAEIRVFSKEGTLYAAPNLIYHYMAAHAYLPPEEFIEAMKKGPQPWTHEYMARLHKLRLSWSRTPVPKTTPAPFRFVRTPDGVKIVL